MYMYIINYYLIQKFVVGRIFFLSFKKSLLLTMFAFIYLIQNTVKTVICEIITI